LRSKERKKRIEEKLKKRRKAKKILNKKIKNYKKALPTQTSKQSDVAALRFCCLSFSRIFAQFLNSHTNPFLLRPRKLSAEPPNRHQGGIETRKIIHTYNTYLLLTFIYILLDSSHRRYYYSFNRQPLSLEEIVPSSIFFGI